MESSLVCPLPVILFDSQFNSLAEDFSIKAAKTGMLADTEHVLTVVENLKKVEFGPLIVDPVMVAKGGHQLLENRCRSDYQRTTFTTSSCCNTESARSRNIIRKKYYNRSRYHLKQQKACKL